MPYRTDNIQALCTSHIPDIKWNTKDNLYHKYHITI